MSLTVPTGVEPILVLPKSGVRVTYKKGMRRVTLQRVLISLIVFQVEKVTLTEILAFYDNLIWCLEKCEKDPGFQRKFGESLKEISILVSKIRFSTSNFNNSLMRLSKELKKFDEYYIPLRNLSGVYRQFRGHFHVLPTSASGQLTSTLPEKPYIGQGYKDKGTRRDPAWDGSPTWQEVATSTMVRYDDYIDELKSKNPSGIH